MPPRDYSHQDLRNRSFKNQDLTGADFSYSDLRGCNFTGAKLTGANFQWCITGQSRRQLLRSVSICVSCATGVLAITAVTNPIGGAYSAIITFFLLLFLLPKFIDSFWATYSISIAFVLTSFIFIGFEAITDLFLGIICSIIKSEPQKLIEKFVLFIFAVVILLTCFTFLLKILLAVEGTYFNKADLARAKFNHVFFKNTDFLESNLSFVDWLDTRFIHTNLKSLGFGIEILQLCRLRCASRRNLSQWNLKNLDLRKIDLSDSVLIEADLSISDLRRANLQNVNLSNAQALGTDFSEAYFTGACIQNWGINSDTNFTNVRCDYIYLEPNQQERKPASGIFQPGDFEKLVHQFTKTLDFLFRNGIDPVAFDFALKQLLVDYEEVDLSLHSLIDLGDNYKLVKFNKENPNLDSRIIHAHFFNNYEFMQKQLAEARKANRLLEKALDRAEGQIAIYEKHETLWSIVLGKSTISIQNSQVGDVMTEGNKIQIGSIGGDASGISGGDNSGVAGKNITGAAGGNISGMLTVTMGQLEATNDPKAVELAELLNQVRTAIEKPDSGLSEADQQKALKHLETLGKLATDKQNPELLEKAGDALDALPTIMQRSDNLANFVEKYFPTFTAGVKAIFALWGVTL